MLLRLFSLGLLLAAWTVGSQIAGPRLVRQYLRDIGVLHSKNEATSTVKISRNRQITRT